MFDEVDLIQLIDCQDMFLPKLMNQLKLAARHAGDDIIDFSMGNLMDELTSAYY